MNTYTKPGEGVADVAAIHLTERAAQKIRALLEKDGVSPEVGGLRVGVQGGGCSGLSYAMRLDTQARDRDKIFEEINLEKLTVRKAGYCTTLIEVDEAKRWLRSLPYRGKAPAGESVVAA